MAKITVRVPSFKKGFPKSLPVPPRLLAFAKWLQTGKLEDVFLGLR